MVELIDKTESRETRSHVAHHDGKSKDEKFSHLANHNKANDVMSQSEFEFSTGKCAKAKSRVILLLLLNGQKKTQRVVLFVNHRAQFYLTKPKVQQTKNRYIVTSTVSRKIS